MWTNVMALPMCRVVALDGSQGQRIKISRLGLIARKGAETQRNDGYGIVEIRSRSKVHGLKRPWIGFSKTLRLRAFA